MSGTLRYLSIVAHHRPDLRFLPRAALYALKFAAFEPFALAQHLLYGRAIAAHEPADPVFVLGYYRSGTTYLQTLLALNPHLATLNTFEAAFHPGFVVTERWLKPLFDRILALANARHPAHREPLRMDFVSEEEIAFVGDARLSANWGHMFPREADWWFDRYAWPSEPTDGWSQMYADFVRRLSFAKGRRLVLKSLPNTSRVPELLRLYPNARFVFLYRDPYAVFESNLKLWRSTFDQHLQAISMEEVAEIVLRSYRKTHDAYDAAREAIPSGHLHELRYEDLLAEPEARLADVYEALQIGGWDEQLPALREHLAARHGKGRADHAFPADHLRRVTEAWRPWIDRWGYPIRG